MQEIERLRARVEELGRLPLDLQAKLLCVLSGAISSKCSSAATGGSAAGAGQRIFSE